MSEADNYRANLAACWQRAAKTSDEVEKRAWLEMGEAWRLLIISGYGSATGEDFAVVSLDGLERGNGPWSWDGRRGLARARLNKQPVWISWVVSRAVHLVNSARGMEMLRRPSLAGWLQKCRTHDLRDIYRWLIGLTGKYLREDRFRKRAASILRLFSSRTMTSACRHGRPRRGESSGRRPPTHTRIRLDKDPRVGALCELNDGFESDRRGRHSGSSRDVAVSLA